MLLTGDAKVGALVMSPSGNSCLSGDSHGAMKLWDLRTKACVETVYNEDGHKPITSLSTSSGNPDGRIISHSHYLLCYQASYFFKRFLSHFSGEHST